MGRFTACSEREWRSLTKELERRLAREFRKKGWRGPNKIDMTEWRKYSKKALLLASEFAIDNCNIDEIVNKVIAEMKDQIPAPPNPPTAI